MRNWRNWSQHAPNMLNNLKVWKTWSPGQSVFFVKMFKKWVRCVTLLKASISNVLNIGNYYWLQHYLYIPPYCSCSLNEAKRKPASITYCFPNHNFHSSNHITFNIGFCFFLFNLLTLWRLFCIPKYEKTTKITIVAFSWRLTILSIILNVFFTALLKAWRYTWQLIYDGVQGSIQSGR